MRYIRNWTDDIYKICGDYINVDGILIGYIKNPTYEMCKNAVRQNKDAINFVDKKYRIRIIRELKNEK
jgi:hypothetical protein